MVLNFLTAIEQQRIYFPFPFPAALSLSHVVTCCDGGKETSHWQTPKETWEYFQGMKIVGGVVPTLDLSFSTSAPCLSNFPWVGGTLSLLYTSTQHYNENGTKPIYNPMFMYIYRKIYTKIYTCLCMQRYIQGYIVELTRGGLEVQISYDWIDTMIGYV